VSEFSQSYTAEVTGSVEDCFAVLTDFEAYPDWSAPVQECRVIDRHPDGLPRRVFFAVSMVKTMRYTLEYTWDKPHGGRWRLIEGDIKDVQGSYRFDPAGARTKATCSQAVDIGFWVPGPIRRPIEQKALRDSVEEFKKAVETRAKKPARG